MARRSRARKREIGPDAVYNNKMVMAMIAKVLRQGKKSIAERIVYGAIDKVKEKIKKDGIEVLVDAVKNVKPVMEVKSRRVGGANYQVPVEVQPARAEALAITWLVTFAKERKGKSMVENLSSEIIDAYNKTGNAFKKREDTHKMAEANKAFAHFRW